MIEYGAAAGEATGIGGLELDLAVHGPYVAAALAGLVVVLLFVLKR